MRAWRSAGCTAVASRFKKIGDGVQAFSVNRHCGIARRWLTRIGQAHRHAAVAVRRGVGDALAGDRRGGRIFAGDLSGVMRAFAR